MFRSKKLGAIVETIDTMWDLQANTNGRVLELEKRIAKLEKQAKDLKSEVEVLRATSQSLTRYCHDKLCKNKACVEERNVVEAKRGRGRPKKIDVTKK